MKAKSKNVKTLRRFERFVDIASDAGSIAMNLRAHPTRLELIGVGLRALGLVMRIHTERRESASKWPWSYFESDAARPDWIEPPAELQPLFLDYAAGIAVDRDYWDGVEDSARVVTGLIGDEIVAWIEDDDSVLDGPYVRRERAAATYRALGDRMWRQLGCQNLAFSRSGLVPDPFVDGDAGVVPTAQVIELGDRLRRFLDADVRRSYLFVGPPGTGKSSAVRLLTRALSLRTLRVDVSALGDLASGSDDSVTASLTALVQILRPEALVLDDIDRASVDGELLQFLELAHRACRVVLATANCTNNMLGAALRPGRFDEVHEISRLDAQVLRRLLGDDADLAERMATLPVAYVGEFVERRRVLGRAAAEAELDALIARCKKIERMTEAGD